LKKGKKDQKNFLRDVGAILGTENRRRKGGIDMKKMLIAALLVATLITTSGPALADSGASSAAAMVVDVFIARPGGFVGTILGSAVFILALPFAALSGSIEPVARTLVVEPFQFTFTRPVGDFSCWE
jgi:hypothetical protein